MMAILVRCNGVPIQRKERVCSPFGDEDMVTVGHELHMHILSRYAHSLRDEIILADEALKNQQRAPAQCRRAQQAL